MYRKNLIIGSLVAGVLALPWLAAAQGESAGASATKPAQEQPATPAQMGASAAKPAAAPATTSAHHASSSTHSSGHSMPKVNLNSATREELAKLPGITEEIADRIIAARPFKSSSELVDKKIVSHAEYEKVHHLVSTKSSASTASTGTKKG
jgi:DNA uptake protein ComE-like DNA-binding protein